MVKIPDAGSTLIWVSIVFPYLHAMPSPSLTLPQVATISLPDIEGQVQNDPICSTCAAS